VIDPETCDEQEAVAALAILSARFAWAGALWTRADVPVWATATEVGYDATDKEFAAIANTWEWSEGIAAACIGTVSDRRLVPSIVRSGAESLIHIDREGSRSDSGLTMPPGYGTLYTVQQ
jgi:hypothetical protein